MSTESRHRMVRGAILAGAWYPSDRAALARAVDGHLDAARGASALPPPWQTPSDLRPLALIAPHAGYRFSGAMAGRAYATVEGRYYRRVVILAPSHRTRLHGVALPRETHFATPLGPVPLDSDVLAALATHPLFELHAAAHAREHAVEIQLPFLQRALPSAPDAPAARHQADPTLAPEWRLIPLVVGQLSLAEVREVGLHLASSLDDTTLFVASTDFTHYGGNFGYVPFPNNDGVAERIEALDRAYFEHIAARDIPALFAEKKRTNATICGFLPIAVLLSWLPETSEATLLGYDTSGRQLADYESSVSYVAAVFADNAPQREAPDETLSGEEQATLLRIARDSLESWVRRRERIDPLDGGYTITPRLRERAGAFVTLHKRGRLRGCIGDILPHRPLYLVASDRAVSAAAEDPRFQPVTADELADIRVEISALSPPHPISSHEDIIIGRHGVLLTKSHHRAVFLPQVAPQQGWTATETLDELAQKAGLPRDAWRRGAQLEVFEATVFGEGAGPLT